MHCYFRLHGRVHSDINRLEYLPFPHPIMTWIVANHLLLQVALEWGILKSLNWWMIPSTVMIIWLLGDLERKICFLFFSTVSSQNASQKTMPNNTTKAGVVVETMSAPNPVSKFDLNKYILIRNIRYNLMCMSNLLYISFQFCPNTRGICCLMALINLGLILVAIGFIIVLQLPEPAFVW